MIAASILFTLVLLYAALLFAVAWLADSKSAISQRLHPVIYALSLSVYCSSWSFYGAVGSAANEPWQHAAIYIGPILLYLFAWPTIKRLLTIGTRQRTTSIADFISSRYGKRQRLAILVTLVATATVLPYIALQLKAVALSWSIITGAAPSSPGHTDSTLFTAVVMALFTILFGTRRLRSDERHTGMMSAIAVESLVKLLMFAALASLAITYLGTQLSSEQLTQTFEPWQRLPSNADFYAQILLSMCAIVCLPRQFHVTVVEYQQESDGAWGRWLLPAYLLVFMLLAVPLSMAGSQLFHGTTINSDIFVQQLPITLNQPAMAIAAFIGGISAATGMAIVATVSLAIMVTNEVALPLWLRHNTEPMKGVADLGDRLRRSRQFCIIAIFFLAWLTATEIEHVPRLTDIGFLSFLAAAQLAPALFAGIYWRGGNALGAFTGISAGLLLWLYCALLPAVLPADHSLLSEGPFGLSWLRPTRLFGTPIDYQLAHATIWSLAINCGLFILLSVMTRTPNREQRQTERFLDYRAPLAQHEDLDYSQSSIRVSQLHALLNAFSQDSAELKWRELEKLYQQRLLPNDRAPEFVVTRIEALLAAEIGAASANRTIRQLEGSQQLGVHDLVQIVSGTNQQYQFTRELLQTTVETVTQGISVVDGSLNLVAWNKSYEQLFDYPPRLLYVGCPIEKVYRFNAERGLMGTTTSITEAIQKRLALIDSGSPYRLTRSLPNGSVIDIRGNPMPNGGFVTIYLDITDYRNTLADLEDARQALQQRVETDSRALIATNAKLRRENQLRAKAESRLREAHDSKSRFMSATSHDLLQPINAARLFTATLKALPNIAQDPPVINIIDNIDRSLLNAEALIDALREISRLDSGKQKPALKPFDAKPFIEQLAVDFQLMASAKDLSLHCHASSRWIYSDPHLLRRIVQNLLSNAIRYTATGRVVIGCRRHTESLSIEVWDTGPGIPDSEQRRIFGEFERLEQPGQPHEEGLGLGLAIAQRCANLLSHPLTMRSRPGHGTSFAVRVPFGEAAQALPHHPTPSKRQQRSGDSVLCIDNDSSAVNDLRTLLESWGYLVTTARDREQAGQRYRDALPCLVIAEYHLPAGAKGVDVVLSLNKDHQAAVPAIIVSADDSEAARQHIKDAGCYFIAKPLNRGRLRATLRQLIDLQA